MASQPPGLATPLARLAASGTDFVLVGALSWPTWTPGTGGDRPTRCCDRVEGQPVKVVGLRTLVELKRGATSAKDRLALAVLEETLRRSG